MSKTSKSLSQLYVPASSGIKVGLKVRVLSRSKEALISMVWLSTEMSTGSTSVMSESITELSVLQNVIGSLSVKTVHVMTRGLGEPADESNT